MGVDLMGMQSEDRGGFETQGQCPDRESPVSRAEDEGDDGSDDANSRLLDNAMYAQINRIFWRIFTGNE